MLHDESGNRLYGSGTLNESKTALILNAENIDIHCDWWGETERLQVDEAVRDFEDLWNGRISHIPVMTLPEAVRRRLVRMAEGIERPVEIDGTSAAPGEVQPPSALERLRFAVLRDAPEMPGGRFVGMETAPVAPWPHQAVVVRRLVETWPHYSGQGAEYFDPRTRQMLSVDREEVKERFLRGEIDVLVCTDAAAEGLNLQTADLLVNFDLGWNPMKVEQRIGRIDRIGQKHRDIYVLNLCYAGSAEEIVYNRLLNRLADANMIVGTQQISLLPVEPEDFQPGGLRALPG